MAFCDFCKCQDCQNGRTYLQHARTSTGKWICDVCYLYDMCTAKDAVKVFCQVPCKNKNCVHRPQIVGEWIK